MKKIMIISILFNLLFIPYIFARECQLPGQWQGLCCILNARVAQTKPKMKLEEQEASSLENFLKSTKDTFSHLVSLQSLLPKTTLELLRAIHQRGLSNDEAELMAGYLKDITEVFQFQNVGAFDENTSHIIGREWHDIDYSGEGMTWKKQKAFYAPYGIEHFKSRECLEKFYKVESGLPYFRKIYKPKSPNALKD